MPGKIEGTNFTGSLLIGHTTSGTLSSADRNTGVGVEALDALTSGADNTALGYLAGTAITTGTNNTFVGKSAGDSVTTAGSNVGMGFYTLSAITTGANNNVAIGRSAMKDSTGANCDDNVAIGISALEDVTGGYNIGIGSTAGDNITSGSGNIIIGGVDAASATGSRQLKIAGYDGTTTTTWISGDSSGNLTFNDNLSVGNELYLASDDSLISMGANFEVAIYHDHNNGFIFRNELTTDDTPIVLTLQNKEADIAADDKIGVINFQAHAESTGTDAILVAAGIEAVSEGDFSSSNNATKLSFKTAASEAAAEKMSLSSAGVLTVSSTITADSKDVILGKIGGTNFARSILIGHATTGTLSSAEDNLGVGDNALNSVTSGDQNICLGSNAGTAITTASANVYIGRNAGSSNATGGSNFGLGVDCLEDASFTGTSNVAIGRSAGAQVESGNFNIFLGQSAGDNITTGHGNLIIGANVDADSVTGSRQLKIAGYDGSTTTTWISGDSNGVITFADDIIIKDAGTIGSASDVDAIAIASNGVVTFSQTPVNSAGAAFVTDDPTALAIALG